MACPPEMNMSFAQVFGTSERISSQANSKLLPGRSLDLDFRSVRFARIRRVFKPHHDEIVALREIAGCLDGVGVNLKRTEHEPRIGADRDKQTAKAFSWAQRVQVH